MRYIESFSTNPYENLAFEQYVQDTFRDDTYILLWQNASTVVIGRNQNVLEEVNCEAAQDLGVTVVRRNTGGGAVYHDLGNLNFSFVTDWQPEGGMDYNTFVQPVIRGLSTLGVTAEKSGRNDILVQGRKISGNAQCVRRGRILHHGTLLLSSDLSMMPKVLNVSAQKIASKGIKSVRSRVANIQEFLPAPITPETLQSTLLTAFFDGAAIYRRSLTEADRAAITALAREKYSTWAWNFGASPKYTYHNTVYSPAGQIEAFLEIADGIVIASRIMGDFLALHPITRLEQAVIGCRHRYADLEQATAGIQVETDYGIERQALLQCLTRQQD